MDVEQFFDHVEILSREHAAGDDRMIFEPLVLIHVRDYHLDTTRGDRHDGSVGKKTIYLTLAKIAVFILAEIAVFILILAEIAVFILAEIAVFILAEIAVFAVGFGLTLIFPESSPYIWFGVAAVSVMLIVVLVVVIWLAYATFPHTVMAWARNVAKPSQSTTRSLGQRNNYSSKPITNEWENEWEGVEHYSLNEAACFWVDVDPQDPIVDARARNQFFRLRSAMVTGKLPYHKSLARVMSDVTGESSLPPGSSILTANSLRIYADSMGDIPTFLQSVKAPVKQELPKEKDVE